MTLFQMARTKVSMSDEKSNPTSSPHWLDRRKVGVGVYACVCRCVYTCVTLCGPRTKRIPAPSLQSPTLRLQTPSKGHVCCPVRALGIWRWGWKGWACTPPWDLMKTLSELKKNPTATAASPSRQPNPDNRAELEKGVTDQSLLQNARLGSSWLA